ncbi:MAG: lipid A biosynthesis acyltransferase [Acidimicrobiales bacterium]|nr:lysophospholipid acyltransferase family protein [Hyphomonadaceae bacterium]RZV44425.1 MAG: lipid A biosynthesis acyltransferase [Acidimicrobiales bacterium]
MDAQQGNWLRKIGWRLEVLGYDIVRLLLSPFPLSWISAFGGKLFQLIGPRTNKHHIAETGMRIAFPDAGDDQIKAWLKESWNRSGRTFAEFPFLHRIKVFADNSNVEVIGIEKFEELKANQKGAILISGHFSNWELMAAVISQSGLPSKITYRPTNNPYFDKRIRAERAAYGTKLMVAKSGARGAKELLEALNGGESIAFLNDQKFNEGLEVPFFGVGAMTLPGPTRLALRTGAPLIPMSIERVKGTRFKVTIHDPIELENTGDRDADVMAGLVKINTFVEDRIHDNPTDWFWVHRRWPKPLYRKK